MNQLKIANSSISQRGMSLIGLVFVLAILGMIALLGAKITPTAIEFFAVKRAIVTAKASGSSIGEIQASFDKQANVAYIESIKGRDLIIEKKDSGLEVSFYYIKKIPLVGPASLLLEYEGTTAKSGAQQKRLE